MTPPATSQRLPAWRLLFIQHAGSLGGSAYSLLYTMQALRARGHAVSVALARPSAELAQLFQNDGFKVRSCPGMVLLDHSTVAPQPWWHPRTWLNLVRVAFGWRRTMAITRSLVEAESPDLVHLNSMPLTPCGAALAEAGVPFVWHVREPASDNGIRTRFIRRSLSRADARIFLSEYDRHAWMRAPDGIVINNFVDLQKFRPEADRQAARASLGLNLSPQSPVILFLGGCGAAKGGLVLLEALALARRENPVITCIAPGTALAAAQSAPGRLIRRFPAVARWLSPPVRFHARLEELGLQPAVRCLPFERNIRRLLAAADLLVFPATVPHFARPIVEASAMGLPSIASDLGGVNELVEDGRTGILVPANDAKALAGEIVRLAADRDARERMGRQARQLAETRFNHEVQVDAIEAAYANVFARCAKLPN